MERHLTTQSQMAMSFQNQGVLPTLRVLHRIHRQIRDLRDRLAQGPRQIRAKEITWREALERLAHLQEESKRLQIAIDEKQLTLKSREENVRKRRAQLMEAKSNREYQLLLDQIRADEVANSTLADEILEDMERLDQLKEKIAAAKEEVAKARQDLEQTRQQVANTEPKLRAEMDGLIREQTQEENKLPTDFRELYDRVVRAKAEDALAPVDGQFCGGCHQQVPLNAINGMLRGEPVLCRACGRLLYLPEEYVVPK